MDDLINDPALVKDVLKDRDHIKKLVVENETLKQRVKQLESLLLVDDNEHANPEEGQVGESVVWEELKKRYPESDGYNVIWSSRVDHEPRYDFKIEKNGSVFCYCDAKTTSRGICNSDSIPFYLRMSQFNFLQQLEDSIPYYVARVFVADNYQIRFFRLSLN